MVSRRAARVGITIALAAVAFLSLRLAAGSTGLSKVPDEVSSPPGAGAPPPVAIGSGQLLGVPWSLVASSREGRFCIDLLRRGLAEGECGIGASSEIEVIAGDVGRGTVYFGPVPEATERVWAALWDGSVVRGILYRPRALNAGFSVYAISLEHHVSGAVVAVDASGELVEFAHFLASGEAEQPAAVVDHSGNVIGYVPINHFVDAALAGTPARAMEIRAFARLPLHPVRSEILGWWRQRPPPSARAGALSTWWRAYPLDGMTTVPSLRLRFP
jgi:hypothetical protein